MPVAVKDSGVESIGPIRNHPMRRSPARELGFQVAIIVSGILMAAILVVGLLWTYSLTAQRLGAVEAELRNMKEELSITIEQRVIYLKVLTLKPGIDRPLAKSMAASVHKHSRAYGKDPDLIVAMIRAESNFVPDEESTAGAVGLMQVIRSWTIEFEDLCDLREVDCNIRNGVRLLSAYEKLYNGNLERALLVYNRGPSSVDLALSKGYNPANGYVENIMRFYKQLKET